ncbi:TPA: hypothetical protein ACX96U_001178 [Clostridium sporogenes]|uniref:hypothetical protein n=1 Tax=Clostridium sporogenes TaxID=1509 RepID=UPI00071793BA|nr:hypothetical protein [Clostridium sporogenes]KRU40621.1 hypothetical protein VT94_22890 [Clostridium sporogenes]MBY7066506.1 hypothetical protein [Clostridium sporogenes]MBY7069174.1 hypothetical protein [Clostridium sporogenes]MCW6065530.1 hypothetical protein [Clostridium sporogenes]MDU6337441.1 hypothetical protein [Clostridium sporogenes]
MKEYYEIRKKYLAEGLAFLGYRYFKEGFGKDTIYKFKNTKEFNIALNELMKLKDKVGKYLE